VALISHIVGNLDITKVLSDKTSIGFGSEIRNETFEIFEGGKASWDGFVPIHFLRKTRTGGTAIIWDCT
jgi:hypothetical protein